MIREFVTLLLADAALYVIARLTAAEARWPTRHGEPPVWLAIVLSLSAFFTHCWVASRLAAAVELPSEMWVGLTAFIVSGIAPAVAFVHMTVSSIAAANANRMYGWHHDSCKVSADYSRARTKRRRGQVQEAVEEYKRYYQREPLSPHALFEAARLLESRSEYHDAAALYRQILSDFAGEDRTWAEAAYHLGNIYQNNMNDESGALALFRAVIRRQPESAVGRLAGKRVIDAYPVAS